MKKLKNLNIWVNLFMGLVITLVIFSIVGFFAMKSQKNIYGSTEDKWGEIISGLSLLWSTILAIIGLTLGNVLWLLKKNPNKKLLIFSLIALFPLLSLIIGLWFI